MEKKAFLSLSAIIETVGIIAILILADAFLSLYIMVSLSLPTVMPSAHIDLAEIALKKYYGSIESKYILAYAIESLMAVFFSFSVTITSVGGALGNVITISPAYPLHLLIQYQAKVIEYLVYLFMAVITRGYIVTAIPSLMLFLVPIGLFFRSLTTTRNMGSSILALAIVVYFIFPLSVLFTDYIISNVYIPDTNVLYLDIDKNIGLSPDINDPEVQKIYQEEAVTLSEFSKEETVNDFLNAENEVLQKNPCQDGLRLQQKNHLLAFQELRLL